MQETLGLKKYKKLVQRTMPTLGWITLTDGKDKTWNVDLDFDHMVGGIVSELMEELPLAIFKKDPINVGEELADAEWYICNLATKQGIILQDAYLPGGIVDYRLQLLVLPGRLTDYHKKALAYGKPYPKKAQLKADLEALLEAIQYVANQQKVNLPEMRLRVIKKLFKRYPDGFSADKALLRNLGIEREVLEGRDS